MPLKVVQSTGEWLPQTQAWLYNQVRFLPTESIESHVVTEAAFNLAQYPPAHMHALQVEGRWAYLLERARRKITGARQFSHWPRTAERIGASVVHSHFAPWGWRDAEWANQSGIKHVVSFYGYDVVHLPRQQPIWLSRYQEMFRSVDQVLCEGPFMAESIVQLGCPREKVRVHRLGVDVEGIRYEERLWDGLEPLKFLIAASFREKKGIRYAIEALGRLRGRVPFELTLIGDSDGSEAGDSEKRLILDAIDAAAIGDCVDMRGFIPYADLLNEAYSHHVFLSPSVTAVSGDCEGGAPVGLIEMAATGMPVVASRHCDIPQIVRHGQTGLLADERDVDGLWQQLSWLVDNRAEWSRLTSAARNLIETDFDARRQGQELAAVYAQLCRATPLRVG